LDKLFFCDGIIKMPFGEVSGFARIIRDTNMRPLMSVELVRLDGYHRQRLQDKKEGSENRNPHWSSASALSIFWNWR